MRLCRREDACGGQCAREGVGSARTRRPSQCVTAPLAVWPKRDKQRGRISRGQAGYPLFIACAPADFAANKKSGAPRTPEPGRDMVPACRQASSSGSEAALVF